MKLWWRERRPYFLSGFVYGIARLIGMTLRLHLVNYKQVESISEGKIFCGWHGRSLIPANFFRHKGYWVIISHSQDGEMQTRVFMKLGYKIIRGSTKRGGVKALIESIRVLKKKDSMAITPDGPRGPSGIVQEGIMMMAKKSGCALVPVATYAKPAWFVPSWDRYMVPCPFARAVFIFGEPIYVATDSTSEQVEELRLKLQNEIHRLQADAKDWVGSKHANHDRNSNGGGRP